MGLTGPLPENVLRCMSAAERRRLGKAGLTQEEIEGERQVENEKELQGIVAGLLNQRNIVFQLQRMDRRSTGTVGFPDFVFSIAGRACAFECKQPGEYPTSEQSRVMAAMTANGWFVRIIHSAHEARAALREISASVDLYEQQIAESIREKG